MTTDTASNGNGSAQQQQSPSLNILAQYVKDLSFEKPGAPRRCRLADRSPSININVNVQCQSAGGGMISTLSCRLSAQAKDGDKMRLQRRTRLCGVFRVAASRRSTCCRCSSSSARASCSLRAPDRSRRHPQRRLPAAE